MKESSIQDTEVQEVKLGEFDPRVVQERDSVTKRIKRVNAHRVLCVKGIRYYEWPKGSLNLWYENRKPAGRLHAKTGEVIIGAQHEQWEAPRNESDDLRDALNAKDFQNQQLMKELEAIKKELAADKFAKVQKEQETASRVVKASNRSGK